MDTYTVSHNCLVDLLSRKPPNVEVWVMSYAPSGTVCKLILKDVSFLYPFKGCLPETEEVYIMSDQDFSMEIAEMLRGVDVPVFGPGGERLG